MYTRHSINSIHFYLVLISSYFPSNGKMTENNPSRAVLNEGSFFSSDNSWCLTNVNVANVSFTWSIRNFSLCCEEPGEYIDSSVFSTQGNTSKWYLRLYSRGDKEEYKDYLSIYLNLKSCVKFNAAANCTLSAIITI